MDVFEDYDRRKRMLDKVIMKKYPDFSTGAPQGGSTRKNLEYGFGDTSIFGPTTVIPEGTTIPINPNNPNLISKDVPLNEQQIALGLNMLEKNPNIGQIRPKLAGPLTDFKAYGGFKSLIGDAMFNSDAKIGVDSKTLQQSNIDTQFFDEMKYIVNPNNGRVLFNSENKNEIQTTLENAETLGVPNAFVLNKKELDDFRKSILAEETVSSFGQPIATPEIIQSSRVATTESGTVDPLSSESTDQIRMALIPFDDDNRTFEAIKNSYEDKIAGKEFTYQLYDSDGNPLSAEDQEEIYGTGIKNPYIPIPDNFDVDYASAGDFKGLVGRGTSGFFNYFGAEAPFEFAKQTVNNRATFDGLLQPILWFRARQLMPKPTSAEINTQRQFLPSFDKNDFQNAALTKTAIVDMQSKLTNALRKRENIKNNVTGGKLDDYDRKLIDEAPALIELLKAMYKQFEAKGRTGQGRANRNFDLSPAVSGNYTGSR